MSKWTHVTGMIRIDALPIFLDADPKEIIEDMLGPISTFDDPDPRCFLPCGSEGSLKYSISQTGKKHEMAWGHISIWGDLRDYQNHEEIHRFLERLVDDIYRAGMGVRSMAVCIHTEGQPQYLLGLYETDKEFLIGRTEMPDRYSY